MIQPTIERRPRQALVRITSGYRRVRVPTQLSPPPGTPAPPRRLRRITIGRVSWMVAALALLVQAWPHINNVVQWWALPGDSFRILVRAGRPRGQRSRFFGLRLFLGTAHWLARRPSRADGIEPRSASGRMRGTLCVVSSRGPPGHRRGSPRRAGSGSGVSEPGPACHSRHAPPDWGDDRRVFDQGLAPLDPRSFRRGVVFHARHPFGLRFLCDGGPSRRGGVRVCEDARPRPLVARWRAAFERPHPWPFVAGAPEGARPRPAHPPAGCATPSTSRFSRA